METLWRVVASMRDGAPTRPACTMVTGDTKVVDRGQGDGIFINTAGVGAIAQALAIGAGRDPCRRRGHSERRSGAARHRDHGAARGAGVRVARSRATARR